MRKMLARIVEKVARRINGAPLGAIRQNVTILETTAVLAAKGLAAELAKLAKIRTLADVEFRVFSQFGEDGILEWLVGKLPGIPETFIEFGVEDYRECNTRFLLTNRNWRGLAMDGSAENVSAIQAAPWYWRHGLDAKAAFIDAENINRLIAESGFSGQVGILSIDIDGNDYWVWEAIDQVLPWIVVIEYNALLGDIHPLVTPYDPVFTRFAAHYSGLYLGSSTAAQELLAARKGYTLLGSNRNGNNAFYVRSDLAPRFAEIIEDRRTRPSRFREARGPAGELIFAAGDQRVALIQDLPFIDLRSGETVTLKQIGARESAYWSGELPHG